MILRAALCSLGKDLRRISSYLLRYRLVKRWWNSSKRIRHHRDARIGKWMRLIIWSSWYIATVSPIASVVSTFRHRIGNKFPSWSPIETVLPASLDTSLYVPRVSPMHRGPASSESCFCASLKIKIPTGWTGSASVSDSMSRGRRRSSGQGSNVGNIILVSSGQIWKSKTNPILEGRGLMNRITIWWVCSWNWARSGRRWPSSSTEEMKIRLKIDFSWCFKARVRCVTPTQISLRWSGGVWIKNLKNWPLNMRRGPFRNRSWTLLPPIANLTISK